MKITLILILMMMLTTSFIKETHEPRILLGTMNLFVNDKGRYYIEYEGKYDVCFMKKLSDILFECDSVELSPYFEDVDKNFLSFDSLYFQNLLPIDSVPPIKKFRI